MKIIITSGGTLEYIDNVRVLTNTSTGRSGSIIADRLANAGYEIYYVHGINAILPMNVNIIKISIDNVEKLILELEKIVPEADYIIHAMAVSDFTFIPLKDKLKSNSTEDFINSLKDRITKNPKVVKLFKLWNPNIKIISFKLESGKSENELLNIAEQSRIDNNSEFVVANDNILNDLVNDYFCYIVKKNVVFKLKGKNILSDFILDFIGDNEMSKYVMNNLKTNI